MKAVTAALLALCILPFASLAVAGTPAAENKEFSDAALRRVLYKMEAKEKQIKDLSADIVQTKFFRDLDDTTVFKGIFRFKKPRRLYWSFYAPDESLIVVNDREALMYVPAIKQVQKLDITKHAKGVSAIFGFDRSVQELKREFRITVAGVETIKGGTRYVLDLKPRAAAPRRMLTQVRLWVPEALWIPQKIMVNELSGDQTTTELFNIKINAGVPDKTFTFTPPKDAEVVNVDRM